MNSSLIKKTFNIMYVICVALMLFTICYENTLSELSVIAFFGWLYVFVDRIDILFGKNDIQMERQRVLTILNEILREAKNGKK